MNKMIQTKTTNTTTTTQTTKTTTIKVKNFRPRKMLSDILSRQAAKAAKQKIRRENQRNSTIERNFDRDMTLIVPESEPETVLDHYHDSLDVIAQPKLDPRKLFAKKKASEPIFHSQSEYDSYLSRQTREDDEFETEQDRIRDLFDYAEMRLDEVPMRCLGSKSNCCNCIECCNV
jgi:hypothetical protein